MNGQLSVLSDRENMRIMRIHEADSAYGGKNLFCNGAAATKQILWGVFGDFCLILPHDPHDSGFHNRVVQTNRGVGVKNMRLMRQHEDMVLKGFYLFRIGTGAGRRPTFGKNMRIDSKNMRHIFMFLGGRTV